MGRVVDQAGLLDGAARASVTETLAELETKTTDQLVLVTLKSLQGTSIEDYGYQLGRRWRVGQKDKNNGVLLIVAPNERQVRIEVGYGLEGTLTDAVAKLIIENSILPRFKTGDFPGGIQRGIEDIVQVLSGDAEEWQRRAAQRFSRDVVGPDPNAAIRLLIFVFLASGGFLIVCAVMGGTVCQQILQLIFLILISGKRTSSRSGSSWGDGSSWSGGGGSFGGGGASGKW